MLRAAFENPRFSLAIFLIATLPILRGIWMNQVQREHDRLIEQSRRLNLPAPIENPLPRSFELGSVAMDEFNESVTYLISDSPHIEERIDAQGGSRYKLIINPLFFEKFHRSSHQNRIQYHSILYDFEGYYPENMTVQEIMFSLNAPRGITVATAKIVLFQQRYEPIEKSADLLVDLLAFNCLLAPEEPYDPEATVARLIACDAINKYVARLNPDDFRKVRLQIQNLLNQLQTESTQVVKNNAVYPFYNFYSPLLAEDTGWMVRPFSMNLINREMQSVTQSQSTRSDAIATPPNNSLTEWRFPTLSENSIPYYRSYLTYIHATSINIACQLYKQDHGKLPDTLDALAPQYLREIPVDLSNKTPKPIELKVVMQNNAPRPILAFDITSNHFVYKTDLFRAPGTHPAEFWIDLSAQTSPVDEGLSHTIIRDGE